MRTIVLLLLSALTACAQTTPYMVQLLQKPNATSAKAWLQIQDVQQQILAGSNIVFSTDFFGRTIINGTGSTGPGSGTVTSFSSGNASPLFTTSVANPTTTPSLTFTLAYTPLTNTATAITNALNTVPVLLSLHANVADTLDTQYLVDVTNAGIGQVSLISSSNASLAALKSVTAGANMTITDNRTNLVFASSGGGAATPSTIANAMIDETNYVMTLRWMPADVADGSGTFGYSGYGDAFSFGGTGGVHARQNMNSSFTIGTWSEIWATTLNTAVFSSSATANAVQPYHNGGFYFQMYLHVRNTNNVRICAGFSSTLTVLTSDAVLTNCAYFRYSTTSNDTTWHGVVCNATNQQVVDTGVSLATDTDYYLQMFKTNGTTNVCFVVNRGSPVTTTSFAPDRVSQLSDCMEAFLGFTPLESATKTNWLRYIGYSVDWVVK